MKKYRDTLVFILRAIIFITIIALFTHEHNRPVYALSDAEIISYMSKLTNVPTFCQYRMAETTFRNDADGGRSWPPLFTKERNKWMNIVGVQNWTYVHHYCFGVREYNEYSAMDYNNRSKHKKHKMTRALEEFEFMRKAQISNFPFMHELFRYESLIYAELGNFEKSQWAFKQSLKYRRK